MLQHLAGLKMASVLVYLPEYLKMIQVAAEFPGIPVNVSMHARLINVSTFPYTGRKPDFVGLPATAHCLYVGKDTSSYWRVKRADQNHRFNGFPYNFMSIDQICT